MQAGPSRLAGQASHYGRAFGTVACLHAPKSKARFKAAASVPLFPDTTAEGAVIATSSTRAASSRRTRHSPSRSQDASLAYPVIIPETPFVPRRPESGQTKAIKLAAAATLQKLKDNSPWDYRGAQMVLHGHKTPEVQNEHLWYEPPPLPSKDVLIIPASATTSKKALWPAASAAEVLKTCDSRLVVQVKGLPRYKAEELPRRLAILFRRSGVFIKAIEVDLGAQETRVVCSSAFDVSKALALSGCRLNESELFFWSAHYGVGDLIDPSAGADNPLAGSLLVLSSPSEPAPRRWLEFCQFPEELIEELERRFPFRFHYRLLPRSVMEPAEGVVHLEVYPRNADCLVREIVHALHNRPLEWPHLTEKVFLCVKEVGLETRKPASIDGSPSALPGSKPPKRAVLVSGLPRDITSHELRTILVDQLKLTIDAVWRHSISGLHPSSSASAIVYTAEDATYQKMLRINGRLEMRGVPIGFVDLCYPASAHDSPPPDAPLPDDPHQLGALKPSTATRSKTSPAKTALSAKSSTSAALKPNLSFLSA